MSINERLLDVLHYVKACLPPEKLDKRLPAKDLLVSSFDTSLKNVVLEHEDPEVWVKIHRITKKPLPNPPLSLGEYLAPSEGKKSHTLPLLRSTWKHVLQKKLEQEASLGPHDHDATLQTSLSNDLELRQLQEERVIEERFNQHLQKCKEVDTYNRLHAQEIDTYEKLFDLYNMLKNDGGAERLEVVCGMAHVVWQKSMQDAVHYPLIIQPCEITFDPISSAFHLRPAQAPPYLHAGIWGDSHANQGHALEQYWQTHKNQMEFMPFDPQTYQSMAQVCAGMLDASGVWQEEVSEDTYTQYAQKTGMGLRISPVWTFFSRARPADRLKKDLQRWESVIKNAPLENIPLFLRQMVGEEIEATPSNKTMYRGLEPLPVAHHETDLPIKDLYFPLPYNDEQVRVIERLEEGTGAVIQGPPGTGKSHTIANVICHYLAQGKRVLVTSEAATALEVVRDKIPESIRTLSVALLSSDAESLKDFERSIQTIAHRLNTLDKTQVTLRLEQLHEQLNVLHARIGEVDAQLTEQAKAYEQPLALDGVGLTTEDLLSSLPQQDTASIKSYAFRSWLEKDPLLPVNAEMLAFRLQALRELWDEVKADYAFVVRGVPLQLPSLLEVGQLHSSWQEKQQLDANDQPYWNAWANVHTDVLSENIKAWKQAIVERQSLTGDMDVQAVMHLVHPQSGTMRGFFDKFHEYYISFRRDVGRVAFDPELLQHPDALSMISQLAEGQSLSMKLLFQPQIKRLLQSVSLDGVALPLGKAKGEWTIVSQRIQEHKKVHQIKSMWKKRVQESGQLHLVELPEDYEEAMVWMHQHAKLGSALMREQACQTEVLEAWQEQMGQDPCLIIEQSGIDTPSDGTNGAQDELKDANAPQVYDFVLEQVGQQRARGARRDFLTERLGQLEHVLVSPWGGLTDVVHAVMRQLPQWDRETTLGWWSKVLSYHQHLWQFQASVEQVQEHMAWLEQHQALTWVQHLQKTLENQARRPEWVRELLEGEPEEKHAQQTGKDQDGPMSSFHKDDLLPMDAVSTWNHVRVYRVAQQLPQREWFDELFEQRRGLVQALKKTYENMVEEKAWLSCANSATTSTRQALQAYLNAVKKIGKGTGKRATRYNLEAREAMQQAFGAIPCWIMPQGRVSENMPNLLGAFDLIVVDEASKSDIMVLPALLRGQKVLVVGDDKQVSPEAVGKEDESMVSKREQFLSRIPLRHQMTQDRSVYDLFLVLFVQENIGLREHFRSAIPIISFSNTHYYNDEMSMLRVPTPDERLDPVLVDVLVDQAKMDGEVNRAEAHAIAYEIKRLVQQPSMKNRTIGVVSLSSKPKYIDYLRKIIDTTLQDVLTPQEQLQHHIAVGSPAFFQGMERDVMFVSSYYVERDFLLDKEVDRQRANVAMSRARDQMYLVRSMRMEQTREQSILRHIMQHFSGFALKHQVSNTEHMTPFERQLYDFLTSKGYVVRHQVGDRQYAIDLVVEGPQGQRLGIECDGDGLSSSWGASIKRQRVLERAGWQFWRCFWVDYVFRQDIHQQHLLDRLAQMGIVPFVPQEHILLPKRVLTWDAKVQEIVQDTWMEEAQLREQHQQKAEQRIDDLICAWLVEQTPVNALRALCESDLETKVFDFLIEHYHVQPQVVDGAYRMDLVVYDPLGHHVVVECDGETPASRVKSYERQGLLVKTHSYEEDKDRDAYLMRQGWQITRVWGSDIHQRWTWVQQELLHTLQQHGVMPKSKP